MALAITKNNYQSEVLQAQEPVIVDVFASWCGPCQHMKPIFAQLEEELGQQYIFGTLNVEEDRELSMELGVSSIPSFLFFKNGSLVAKEVGMMSADAFKEKIAKHLK